MPLPRWIARANKRVTNRFIEPLARRTSGFAVVEHRGRHSGRSYRTPVNVFDDGEGILVALTYGPQADWFQNIRATGGVVTRSDERHQIVSVDQVGRTEAWPALPRPVRVALRVLRVRDFCRLTLTP